MGANQRTEEKRKVGETVLTRGYEQTKRRRSQTDDRMNKIANNETKSRTGRERCQGEQIKARMEKTANNGVEERKDEQNSGWCTSLDRLDFRFLLVRTVHPALENQYIPI